MKLIRRKRKPTPAQKALDVARTAIRGLVAVRLARSAFKAYKFARRLPLLIGLGAAGAVVAAIARKRSGGSEPQTETWSPPASAAETPAAAPAPELTPNPTQTAGTGTPPVDEAASAAPPAPAAPADDLPVGTTGANEDEAEPLAAAGSSSEADTEDESKT